VHFEDKSEIFSCYGKHTSYNFHSKSQLHPVCQTRQQPANATLKMAAESPFTREMLAKRQHQCPKKSNLAAFARCQGTKLWINLAQQATYPQALDKI
jgi:hypothetical protein